MASESTKTDCSTHLKKMDSLGCYNYIVMSIELLYEAARDGSRDAAEFLHEEADRFIMKAGDVS